ncbi:MAG: hypothetical protein JRN42_04470 [Nitrososphaerota archaeon]|nr:hypothetical protein [Nitrososphaerota archaeon]
MSYDPLKYNRPGVTVVTDPTPQIGDLSRSPTVVALIGPAVGYETATQTFTLTSGGQKAQYATAVLDGLQVMSATSGTAVQPGAGGYSASIDGSGYLTISAADGGMAGQAVIVTYRYTPATYWDERELYDFQDVAAMYGNPFVSAGVNSQLSLAAMLAMRNRASSLRLIATPDGTLASFQAALAKLANDTEVNVVVPVSGDPDVHGAVVTFVNGQTALGNRMVCVLGRDGSSTPVPDSALKAQAASYASRRVQLASPSSLQVMNPVSAQPVTVGSQYFAAMVAGMRCALPVQAPLTWKQVAGVYAMSESYGEVQKDAQCAAGLLVLEVKRGVARIRDDLTTSIASDFERYAALTRAEDYMMEAVQAACEPLVGTVFGELTIAMVKSFMDGALYRCKNGGPGQSQGGVIQDYRSIQARQRTDRPATLEGRFVYSPSWPVEDIVITFTQDVVSGQFSAETGANVQGV